ncbi:unnamed protein product [Oncorhynchus mykiss]|uniref:E3 ubiquitin-protein ligase n=1 Tax=Oncorhynchus mykiss TaxID=8022 RepID=A0A060WD06_ONCMY|nr:unnamed protein product [Oncorhynchus mykiss]
MLLASAVVVWEWLNEHGRWRPYSPAVSHHIEAVIRNDPRGGSVVLGQVDSRLSPYIIDLHSMHQFRQDTGTLRPVRRSFYDPTSAPGQGWLWEWENDTGSWTAYDTEVGIAIQAARDRQQPWLDLAPLGFCYLIDFQSMTQINGQTQRCRRIQRRSDLAYPLVSGPLPKTHHAWGPSPAGLPGVGVSAPCACQQCMLVLSPPSPKLGGGYSAMGGSYSLTLPRPPSSMARSLSPHRTSAGGASAYACRASINIDTVTGSVDQTKPHSFNSQVLSTFLLSLSPSLFSSLFPLSSTLPPSVSHTLHVRSLARACSPMCVCVLKCVLCFSVPTVPVKNLNGSSPVHPALAGITGILMSAAGLPVCLTRPPKLVLHPPPVSKSDIKPVPGLGHCCRKTTKKQARKGGCSAHKHTHTHTHTHTHHPT